MTDWLTLRLRAFEARLERLSPAAFGATVVGATLLLSLVCFSPKFQLWDFAGGESYEVVRARTFLAQCASPFRRDIEPAMQWRLLPPLLCHALGLRGWAALALPWCGLLALLGTCAAVLRRAGLTRLQAALATALTGTTSAVLVPLDWLGMNDAWVWAGLVGVGFGRTAWSLGPACLLLPWVDERFIIGFPLAFAVRCALSPEGAPRTVGSALRRFAAAALWLLPYAALRLGAGAAGFGGPPGRFAAESLRACLTWLPWAPLGWWMALRAGWAPVGFAFVASRRTAFVGAILVLGTLAVMAALAADLSRSAAILLPVMLLGIVRGVRRDAARADRCLAALLLLNLALPVLHVVYTRVDLVSPLPIELLRLGRKWHAP